MYIENTIVLRGDWADLWRFSSEIERWVEWLPHYRKIDILETLEGGRKRRAYMSCWRDLLPLKWETMARLKSNGIPAWLDLVRIPEGWTTVQTLEPNDNPAQARIRYNHVGGPTKGMEVIWTFEPLQDDYYRVSISHDWRARWPIIGGMATYLIQTHIIHDIADKTLKTMKRLTAQAKPDTRQASLTKAAL